MSRISFSEQALSVTKANSAILGGYISSTLAAMKRDVTPMSWRCCFGTSALQDKYRSMKSIVKWYVSLCILYTSHTSISQSSRIALMRGWRPGCLENKFSSRWCEDISSLWHMSRQTSCALAHFNIGSGDKRSEKGVSRNVVSRNRLHEVWTVRGVVCWGQPTSDLSSLSGVTSLAGEEQVSVSSATSSASIQLWSTSCCASASCTGGLFSVSSSSEVVRFRFNSVGRVGWWPLSWRMVSMMSWGLEVEVWWTLRGTQCP